MASRIPKRVLATMLVVAFGSTLLAQFKPAPAQYPPFATAPGPPDSGADGGADASPDLNYDPAQDSQHGVARISLVGGEVNIRRGDGGQLVAAAANAPLEAQDHLLTGSRSSAEVQLDASTILRVAENSDISFADLQNGHFQAQLNAGSVIYRVLRATPLQGEVDTPNIVVRAAGPTEMRIYLSGDGTTQVAVRSGLAEILGPAGSERLDAGHAYVIRGDSNDPEFQESAPAARDTFDDWSAARDAEALSSRSGQYVGSDIPGGADLDGNGNWVPSQYGQVWTPSGMPADWAPYSNGQWAYTNYYGWTWIDYAPWGWAPYHYGRWFFNAGVGWCWWPGARIGYHYWSPALVGFFGWRGGYRGLGWAPLAPYERVHPWWGRGAQPFGFGAGGSILASYRNAGFRGGAHYANYNSFGTAGQRFGSVSREQLSSAGFIGGHLPVSPGRESYNFAPRQAFPGNHFTAGAAARPAASPLARPAGTGWSHLGSVDRSYPAARIQTSPSAVPRSPAASSSGWRRFGDPGGSAPARQGFVGGANGNDSGWHQFGRPAPAPGARSFGFGSGAGNRNTYSPQQPRAEFSTPQPSSPRPPSQSFRAPAQPHWSNPAPQSHNGPSGGGNRGGGGGGGSNGGSHSGGHGRR